MITGRNLIDLGFKIPTKCFGILLNYLNSLEGNKTITENLNEPFLVNWLRLMENSDVVMKLPKNFTPDQKWFEESISILEGDFYLKKYSADWFDFLPSNTPYEVQNKDAVLKRMLNLTKLPTVVDGNYILPDACPAGDEHTIPVGTVIVTEGTIHPSMHSSDIACTVSIMDMGLANPTSVLDKCMEVTVFGRVPKNHRPVTPLPTTLLDEAKNNRFFTEKAIKLLKSHLNTLGDGNHFAFVGKSARSGNTFLALHSGSRGAGACVYKEGVKVLKSMYGGVKDKTISNNLGFDYNSDIGKEYYRALLILKEWTIYNHKSTMCKVLESVNLQKSCDPLPYFASSTHNFVFKEGTKFYHAKGATPISNESLSVIPLNMSSPILLVKPFLGSKVKFAPHGAGRNTSRTAYLKTVEGKSIESLIGDQCEGIDVRFYSGVADVSELPNAYKDPKTIIRLLLHHKIADVVDMIKPFGSIMAGVFKKY